MLSKLPKPSLLKSAALALSLSALGGVTSAFAASVSPVGPQTIIQNTASESTVYYLGSQYVDSAVLPDESTIAPGFSKIDFATTSLVFNVAGADPAQGYFWVLAESNTSGTFYPITMSGCGGGPITANGPCFFNTITDFQISVNLNSICAGTGGTDIRGCDAGKVIGDLVTDKNRAIPGVRLRFLVGTNALPAPTGKDGLIVLYPQIKPPTITLNTCAPDPGFFPGDQVILVDTGAPRMVAAATTGSSPSFPFFWIFAKTDNTAIAAASAFSSDINTRLPYAGGQGEVMGFENSTDAVRHLYGVRYGVQDSAGAVAFCPTSHTGVFSTDIQGFLRESNCFIATASYRDGRAPGVMLLREFRDEILTNSKFGRSFIGWYYENGPIAANWLIDHSVFRGFFLTLLLPLQALAWVALHPVFLLFPFAALLALLFFATREKKKSASFLVIALALTGALNAGASDQPYIDSLISELPKESYTPTPENASPYINSIKKGAGVAQDSDGYAESLQKELPAKDGSEGYGERLQQRLPKTSGSAIEDYRLGRKLRADKGSLETRDAFGFKILASANRTYTTGPNQSLPYSQVYGSGWVPDFALHYEHRPFTGDFLKKFGLYSSIGASFTKAKGVLAYKGSFGSESKTEFKFIVLPVNVGFIYRINMFNFLYPYFGGGPSAIGFVENRDDKRGGKHGYTFGYWYTVGVALGLDWMSAKSSWDQYSDSGVKHSYFTIGYNYLESLGGGLVEFTVDGVEVGFTFEL